MKNYKIIALMVSSVLAAGAANAETKGADNVTKQGNINKELSEIRAGISAQVLQNKLYDAELEGLKRRQEIKSLESALDGSSDISIPKSTINNVDQNILKFDETLNNEDILISDNEWDQNVGFIYQDTLDVSGKSSNASPISGLTESTPSVDDNLLSDMLASAIEEAEAEDEVEETESEGFLDANMFKLTSIEVNKLVVKDDYKSAELKVSYITDNGFQKIRGAKITKAITGKVFDVKGEERFEVKEITKQGVVLINLKNKKEIFVSK